MTDENDARNQAAAQFRAIAEMVARWKIAEDADDDDARETIETEMRDNVLSVEVRTGWRSPGSTDENEPEEFRILLCTGGPAVQIYGDLGAYGEAESAVIQYQDWGTPWTDWRGEDTPDDWPDILDEYCRHFYFGG